MPKKKPKRRKRTTRIPIGLLAASGATLLMLDNSTPGYPISQAIIAGEKEAVINRVNQAMTFSNVAKALIPLGVYVGASMIVPAAAKRKLGVSAGGVRASLL